MAKTTKSFCLSSTAINRILKVQKDHGFTSESSALDYILNSQADEEKLKELIYGVVFKILSEKNISLSIDNNNEIKKSVNTEVEKTLLNATDNIFENMPE